MSEAGLPATAGAGSQATTDSEVASRPSHGPALPTAAGSLPALIMIVGGLLTGAIASAGMLAVAGGSGSGLELHSVAQDQLESAIVSMASQAPAATIADARQCKAPLAVLTVSASGASTIRIRSGSFLSPLIQLTPAARRVAIPFPAPYATGQGVLVVEGAGQGVNVWLSPGQHYANLSGAAPINVVWTPKSPC